MVDDDDRFDPDVMTFCERSATGPCGTRGEEIASDRRRLRDLFYLCAKAIFTTFDLGRFDSGSLPPKVKRKLFETHDAMSVSYYVSFYESADDGSVYCAACNGRAPPDPVDGARVEERFVRVCRVADDFRDEEKELRRMWCAGIVDRPDGEQCWYVSLDDRERGPGFCETCRGRFTRPAVERSDDTAAAGEGGTRRLTRVFVPGENVSRAEERTATRSLRCRVCRRIPICWSCPCTEGCYHAKKHDRRRASPDGKNELAHNVLSLSAAES